MLTRDDLKDYINVVGFNLWQVEKDYLQHLILTFLFQRVLGRKLVFKGGTALQKVFGLNRFSLDLDFTYNNKIDFKEIFERIVKDISLFGFPTVLFSTKKYRVGETYVLKIKGPLYTGVDISLSTIRIEISFREKVILEPIVKEIVPIYIDLRPYTVVVMNPEEILAEKFRALIYRRRARDLYDLWFLLRKDIKPKRNLIEEKLKYYDISFNLNNFIKCIDELEDIWYSELKPLLKHIPSYNVVKNEVNTYLTRYFENP